MSRKILELVVLTTLMFAVVGTGRADADMNLVVNGGFETGDFSGFTLNNQLGGTKVGATFTYSNGITYVPHGGTYFAALGNNGSDATISQTIADAVGTSYNYSFFLANDGKTPNDFKATWDGQSLLAGTSIGASPYTQYSFTVIGTGSDTISFAERNDPGYFSLDDISLMTAVPEPRSLLLLAISAALSGLAFRRRRLTLKA